MAYRCEGRLPAWTEDSFLEYVLDPEGYVARAAAEYVTDKQEQILYQFMCNSLKAKAFIEICGNPRNQAHSVKAIMQAMLHNAAKTVRVTVIKNNIEFSFKTDARAFRHDSAGALSHRARGG